MAAREGEREGATLDHRHVSIAYRRHRAADMPVRGFDDEGLLRSPTAHIVMRLVRPRALPLPGALFAIALAGSAAAAQSEADVVRGRVTDDSARAVAGATIMITR